MTKATLQMDTYFEWNSTGMTNRDCMLEHVPLNLLPEFVPMTKMNYSILFWEIFLYVENLLH